MKYAFMSSSAPAATLDQLLTMAEDWGYAGIEPRIEWGHGHAVEPTASASERQAIRAALDASPVELCCIATGCRLSDAGIQAAEIERAETCIELAGDVGCRQLRVFGGNPGDGVERAEAIATLVDGLGRLIDHALKRDVTLLLETHDAWTNPDDVAEVVRRVDHPNLAVLWDVMHPLRTSGWSIDEAFAKLRPWIRHVHIHDALLAADRIDFRPIGEGEIDHQRVIALLHGAGFEGYLSGEWINWQPPEEHLPREIATLKAYERSLGAASA